MKSVFILTSRINAYDQAGEYFETAFKSMPSADQLLANGVPLNRLHHVMNGGGRIHPEDKWFYLREFDL